MSLAPDAGFEVVSLLNSSTIWHHQLQNWKKSSPSSAKCVFSNPHLCSLKCFAERSVNQLPFVSKRRDHTKLPPFLGELVVRCCKEMAHGTALRNGPSHSLLQLWCFIGRAARPALSTASANPWTPSRPCTKPECGGSALHFVASF